MLLQGVLPKMPVAAEPRMCEVWGRKIYFMPDVSRRLKRKGNKAWVELPEAAWSAKLSRGPSTPLIFFKRQIFEALRSG
jgi:hypothetical protein